MIIIIVILAIIFIIFNKNDKEHFLNPYSCDLYKKILSKHYVHDRAHRKRFFSSRYYVPQYIKE